MSSFCIYSDSESIFLNDNQAFDSVNRWCRLHWQPYLCRFNRNPDSSKTYINQWLTCKNSHRVIFRVIGQKLHIATGEVKTWFFRFWLANFDPKTSTTGCDNKLLKSFRKLLRAYTCLTEYAINSSNFYFLMIWNDATLPIPLHNNMASRLSRNNKA